MFTSCAKKSKTTPISVRTSIKVIAPIARRAPAKKNNCRHLIYPSEGSRSNPNNHENHDPHFARSSVKYTHGPCRPQRHILRSAIFPSHRHTGPARRLGVIAPKPHDFIRDRFCTATWLAAVLLLRIGPRADHATGLRGRAAARSGAAGLLLRPDRRRLFR